MKTRIHFIYPSVSHYFLFYTLSACLHETDFHLNEKIHFYSIRLFGVPVAQSLTRRTIDQEVESSNQASDRDKGHRVAKGRGPLLANSISSTEMRHPPALSLPTLTLMGMGDIFIFSMENKRRRSRQQTPNALRSSSMIGHTNEP